MCIVVHKYGGSSLADLDKIKLIAQKIAAVKNEGHDIVVVVSAMGKTTNSLIEMAKELSSNPTNREMDMLFSTGERITMSLLCIALNELGIDAISLTGSQAGIITNSRHTDARVIEVRPFRVEDELALGKIVVVGGFQGVSYKRDITTLGRGGSDTSAVALAAALDAERCEIYSDVDGVYSADPNIVDNAIHIPEISYQQMQEMSKSGAKVLNAQAVQFAKENNIAIYARSTFGSKKETIIRKIPVGITKGIKSVVHEKSLILVSFSGGNSYLNYKGAIKFLADIHINSKAHKYDFENKFASFIISDSEIDNSQFIKQLKNDYSAKVTTGLSGLSLIGEGLNDDDSLLYEVIEFFEEADIKLYSLTTTSFRISLLLEENNLEEAAQLAHNKWIGI